MNEIETKLQRVRQMLADRQLDGVLISNVGNFAWLTGGAANYVNVAIEAGPATALVTRDAQYVIVNNIEATRLEDEEELVARGFDLRTACWYEDNPALVQLCAGRRIGSDTPRPETIDVAGPVKQLRLQLLPEERERAHLCARSCSGAMAAAMTRVRPGMTEVEIAGILASEALARDVWPLVNLIATDERIFRYRHPLPTGKRLERYAMLVLGGRRRGLICSVTRLVYFGALPEDIRHKQQAGLQVDAALIAATRPGRRLRDILQAGIEAYVREGYPAEWQRHHQGGLCGYAPREYLATPTSDAVVAEGQFYAWNPTIAGFKAEDTIEVGPDHNEIITEIPGWPMLEVEVNGQVWRRPAIMEVRD